MKQILTFLLLLHFTIELSAQRTVGTLLNSQSAFDGYTLFAPMNSTITFLVDNCGNIANSWSASSFSPGASVYLLEDGALLRTCKLTSGSVLAGGSGGRFEKYDWNENLIWSYNFDSPTHRAHHDIVPLPNGNIILIAWDIRSRQEAINKGLDTSHYDGEIWSEKIVEIEPIGSDSMRIVWEWFLWDHLVQDFNNMLPNFGAIDQSFDRVDLNYYNNNGISKDYFHANSLSYNPHLDQLMISIRNYDEFWIIDHSTTTAEAATSSGGRYGKGGRVLYRWGNPEAYGQGSVSDKMLFGQHDPNWIPQGYRDENKIIVFNNGFNRTPQESKVQILSPPIDTNGNYLKNRNQMFGPVGPDWEYTLPVFVDFVSGASRLKNGNTFISSGPDGNMFEIDANDSLVWQYVNPIQTGGVITNQGSTPSGNTLFRGVKYSSQYPAFIGRNLASTTTIESNPPSYSCNLFVGINDIVKIEQPSKLIGNPFSENLLIESNEDEKRIQVISYNGQLVYDQVHSEGFITINSSQWNNGMYLILISNDQIIEKLKAVKVN